MFFQYFSIITLLILSYSKFGQGQTILDQNLLRSTYSSYDSATSISFTGKSISHIDHNTFAGVTSVQTIDLSNNAITVISQAFNPFYYYLVYTSTSKDPYNCFNTGVGTFIRCAPGTHFDSLSTINLSNNKISHIDMDSMLGTVCETLDLSHNSLTKLVYNQLFSTFSPVYPKSRLRKLYLNNNQLTDISGLFTQLTYSYSNLTHINLSYNKLTQITSSTFSEVTSLTHLYLNNNNINAIDSNSFVGLVNLRQLHFYNNPFYLENGSLSQILQYLQLCTQANNLCFVCSNSSCSKSLASLYTIAKKWIF